MDEARRSQLLTLLKEGYDLRFDLERRISVSANDPLAVRKLKLDLEGVNTNIAQWEAELTGALAQLPATQAEQVRMALSALRNTPPLRFYVPFNRNELFQERPGEFAELERRLLAENGQPVRLGLVGVTGMGGIGKTQLAVELAYRLQAQGHFPGGIYWMLATDGLDEWQARLAALADAIEYRPPDDNPGQPDNPQRRARYLARYLCRTATALLVLDNVEQPGLTSRAGRWF